MSSLDKEYEYFVSIRRELVAKYAGQFAVIKDQEVAGVFPTEEAALAHMEEAGHSLGTFLVQPCISEAEERSHRFHSRITTVG